MLERRLRRVIRIVTPTTVLEGAGVKLQRLIGGPELDMADPFLLLDQFHSDDPADFIKGFPSHPHRGIETVTYMLKGRVDHRDSLGNQGSVGPGDVQWMTAGRGIIHSEMPANTPEGIWGFQLWVNLPSGDKMSLPRYQDIDSPLIPEVTSADQYRVRIIAGRFLGIHGPVRNIAVEPTCLDVELKPDAEIELDTRADDTVLALVIQGAADFDARGLHRDRLLVLGPGERLKARAGQEGCRFIFLSGTPLNEPVARWGPFVMNTQEEIIRTLQQLRDGNFLNP